MARLGGCAVHLVAWHDPQGGTTRGFAMGVGGEEARPTPFEDSGRATLRAVFFPALVALWRFDI